MNRDDLLTRQHVAPRLAAGLCLLALLLCAAPREVPAWDHFMGAQLAAEPDTHQKRLWRNLESRWKKVLEGEKNDPIFAPGGKAKFPQRCQTLWDKLTAALPKDNLRKAREVCGFLNTQFAANTDKNLYGVPEKWASPAEMVAKGGGDSEDFAFLKYFALRSLGFAADDLRLLIVELPGGGNAERWDVLLAVRINGLYYIQDFTFRPADLLMPANDALAKHYKLSIAFNEDGASYYAKP
ncbi:MAG: transglutaminase-like cysteine peptidase [Desulfovibrio sp.]|jgi:predicted transglutaminase-like cysteine proteinase|nr:transglutaminase-like cysteine peptidase [Desulfovibrio sp.]